MAGQGDIQTIAQRHELRGIHRRIGGKRGCRYERQHRRRQVEQIWRGIGHRDGVAAQTETGTENMRQTRQGYRAGGADRFRIGHLHRTGAGQAARAGHKIADRIRHAESDIGREAEPR